MDPSPEVRIPWLELLGLRWRGGREGAHNFGCSQFNISLARFDAKEGGDFYLLNVLV